MPEKKKYLIEIPGQEGVAYWGEERYNANKDALLKDHPDAIIAEVGSYSAEDAKDTDEYIINIPGKSGSAHWNAERFNANRDNLLKDFPNAQIQRVRPIDYWEDQRTDLNKRLEEHNAQYGSFLSEYENKREMERARGLMGDSMRNTPESDYLLENAREYSLRNKEKEALLKALHDNPREQQRKQNLYDSIMEMSSAVEQEGNESYKASLAQYVAEGGNIAAPGADAVISNMSENRLYNGALRFLESAKETMEAPSKFDETNGFLNFMKGAGHTFGSPDFWTFGLTSIVDNLGARDAFEKIWSKFKTVDINKLSEDEIEQMLTPGERALVEAFTKKAMADSERANDLSLGYQSGMTSAESLGFMAQFILTGGVTSSVAKGATKWAAKGLARGFGNLARQGVSKGMMNAIRGAGKFALGTTRSLIDAAVRTGITTTAPKSISEQLLPNIQQGTLPEANKAILKGLGDAFIENWSESYGEILGSVFKAPMNALFPEWSKAIARTPFMQVAERAGFNGYLTEIGEEWFGNAMRTITQVDPNALKDFATVDNQIVTMTAFLPMTLIGGGVSMGQRRAAEKDLENKTMNLRHTLEKAGLNIDEIDALVDYRQSLSPQMLSDRFAPLITRIAHMPGNGALASEIFKSAGLFSQSVARYQAMEGGYQAEEDNAKTELRDEIVNKMGGNRFWNTRQSNATNENGEAYEFDEVQVITRADGSRFFIMGQMGDQLSTIDEDGRMGFTTEEELNKQFEDGIITSNRTMMLDQFLSEDVVARRREVEAQRMSEQAQSQIADLRANNPIGTVVNLGTRVNPISGVVVRYEQDRAILQTENHENPFISLSYEQLAQALNTPIRVLNDEQMAAEEAALIEADRAERETELADTPDDMSVAEESTHSAAEFEEETAPSIIPMNEDGSVDEAKFLEENPEEYVAWNDNNMQDGGADSREQLQMLIPVYQNMYNEAAKNWAANAANPVARRAAKASMAEWQEKIDRINNILSQYNMPSQENQPLADRTIQAELDDLHDGSLNDEEIASNIDAHIAEAQAAYDEYAKTAPIMGTDRQAYKTAKAEFEEGLKGLQQELDYWNEVKKANERYGEMVQQAEYEAMETRRLEAIKARVAEIAQRLGAGVNVIERPEDVTDAAAKREIEAGRPPLGWFNVDTGKVDLYLPGIPSAQIAEETIMHEIVGHKGLRGLLGKDGFNDLCDAVWNYMESNLSRREQEFWLQYPSVNGDKRKAADEYMAHMAETVDFNEDRSTWEKIVNFIKDALRKIGLEVGVNDEYIVDMLKRSYAKMREESEVAPATAEEFLEESGFEVDEERDDIRLSSRYVTTEGQEAEITDAIVNVTGRSKEDAERWLQSEKSAASIVLADKQHLDYIPDDRYKAIKDNSDYPQGTVDFNNICRKRVSFTKMFTRLQRRYPNRVFTANDLADIRTIMSNDGLTVACGLCYVEDRRQMIGEVAAFFIDQMQKNFEDYTYEVSAKDFAEGKTKRKKLSKDKIKKAAKYAKLIGNDTYVPQIYDLTTAEGLDKLHNEHKGIWDAFQAFNSDRGQQAQNLFQGYAEYKREILGWSKAKVKKVNSLGGLRVFSYSDFEAHHLLDLIQIIIDCAAKGVMIQGYTKVPEFARAVANTGIKLNRSLIPLGDTGIVDGKLAYDSVEGIDTSDANFLESNDNVGNILIGINDEQIRLAMNDPFVHYIIPYHARQAKEILAKMKVGNWTNYLDFQNERNISDGKRVKKGINIYTDVLNETITNDREFVERYLEVCREKGYIPKFDQFLNKDAEGNYVYTPGYYKFLVDFKLFDESGNILPQKPVVAEFDDAFNAEILQKYVADEKQSTGDQMNATYAKIVKALGLNEKEAEGEDIRFKAAPRTDEERARLFETAKQQYGVTDNFKVAGYMLPDGSLLDFGDKNEPNVRSLDHRNIEGVIMDEGREYDSRWQYVTDFLNEGAIRLMPESDAINLSVAPSAEQRKKLLDYFYKKNGYIILEINDENGNGAVYMEYDKGTSPYRIMRDIDGYFNEGIVPQQTTMFKASNSNQAIFVSNASKAVEGIKMEKATPEQWLKMIEKNGGLKAGEDKWMGLSDWLKASDKKTLTKQEVLDFINENMIVIDEQHYSNEEMGKASVKILNERYQGWEDAFSFEWDGYMEEPSADISDYEAAAELYNKHHDDKVALDEDGEFEDMDTYEKVRQFGVELSEIFHGSKSEVRPIDGTREQYTTQGLQHLHEIALTVPTIESWNESDDIHFGDAGEGRAVAWIRFGETTSENGESVLVIDEIQSKRHQEGREKGYRQSVDEFIEKQGLEFRETNDYYELHWKEDGRLRASTLKGVEGMSENADMAKKFMLQSFMTYRSQPAIAPFEKNWHELAMKRMLRYAAENGYGVVAWTKGEQQNKRYNISKVVDKIYVASDFASTKGDESSFRMILSNGDENHVGVNKKTGVVTFYNENPQAIGKPLSDLLGKELADKILAARDYQTFNKVDFELSEGMKGFYDKMLPSFMNKYGKKWGVKVEDINLPHLEDGLTMHSVPVTEEMKQSVMEGQLMFSTKTYPASEEYATMFSTVTDPFKVAELESGKKIPAYRSVQIDDEGRIYSPMASRIQSRGRRNEAAQMREWDQAVENLDLVTRGEEYGKITILDEDGGQTKVAYNPYGHCCVNSMMNDQFKRAWERDGLYVMKVEAPESELTSGYKAEQAKDAVGIHIWKTGAVGRKLPESKRRQILLTRWMKNVQVMTWEEVAQDWINTLKGENVDVPFNVIPRKILNMLADAGVKIVAPEKGMENALSAYNEWKSDPFGYVGDTALPAHVAALNETKKPSGPDGGMRFSTETTNFASMDSNGKQLTPSQQEFFANSKAVDKDGDLLVLYHGTPRAGFTEFKGGWFTTSKEDAVSYSGDRKGRLFDPNEEYVPETLTAGDYRLGYMTFDSEEDRADFLKRFPTADTAMSERDYEVARLGADEEYDELTARRKGLKKIWDAYWEYERERFVDSTIGDILDNPESYTEEDMQRAMLAYDSNASMDSLDETVNADERKDMLIAALAEANEETEGGIRDIKVETRVPRNGEGVKHNDSNRRTYEVYANIQSPYEVDANGRGSEFVSGDVYKAVEEALADEQYDGVIIRNWRVGRYQQLGDVVVPKNGNQIKLTSNENPTKSEDIRFSTRQPNQTAVEFHQAVVNDFKSKYNDIADIQVFPINEETAKRFDFTVDELEEVGGTYVPEEDLIAIFAREAATTSFDVEESIFHELVHKLSDFFEYLKDTGKWMWEAADKYKVFALYKDHILEKYEEKAYYEEMLSFILGFTMACGGASKLYNGVPEDIQKHIDDIFNEIGYDRERESNERLLRLDDESSVEEAEGSKREENGGRGESETEEILFSTNREPVEEVVDKGLVLSVEDFTNLAIDIYKAIPESARRELVDNASRNDWKLRDAILQMPASLAMKKSLTDEEVEVAKIIAQKVEDAVIANGTGLARHLTTNEALWMLYRASNPISESNPFAMAERAVVADHLGFSPKAKEIDKAGEDEIRFRKYIYSPVASAAEAYTEAVSYWGNRMNEAFVDQYDAVDQMMKAIEDATGKKAETWEDIRLALTQSASKGFAKLQKVEKGLIQKMWDAVNAFAKEGVDEEKLARYVLLKHGLERNKVFAQRDARRSYEEEFRAEVKRIKNDSTLTDAEKKLRIDDAKNILDAHILDIDNETDVRYLENRKTDYSGVLAMFADYPGLMPADNYSSMEEYRSARRKSRKPRFKKLSKAEAEAQMECDAFEAGRDSLVNDLWDSINNLTKGTLKMQYEYGMLSADAYKSLSKMFKYYVPMRGFSDNTGEDLYDYYSHNVSDGYAPALIGAKGRKSEAESPFGWMAAMAATAIVSGEKNAAKQALYYFAMNRRVNDLLKVADAWYVQSPTDPNTYYPEFPPQADPNKTIAENAQQYADWEKQMEDLRSQGKAVKKTNRLDVAEVANFGVKDAPEHIIKVNIAGEEKQLILNANPRAAQAINGLLNIESNPDYQKVLGRVLRWMSQVSTGWNPEFWMTNISRDSITAFAAIGIKEDKVYNEAWRKNWVEAWKIVKLLPKLKDGTLGTGRLEDLLREAVENGVQTGYSHIKSMEEWDKDMNKYLKELNKDEAKAVTAVKKFVDGVQTLSESMELVSRFATYITSRELGRDITRSVSDAKEVTVNFNRKGSGMRITFEEAKKLKWADGTPIFSEKWKGAKRLKGMLSVAYVSGLSALAPFGRKYMMFFNAGVQGVNMWLQMYRKGYGKKVNALAGAAFALGVLNSVIQGIIDGDDNDYQENIGDYERRSNLMLGAKGFYLKFALPQELKAFYGLGDILYNYGAGNYHHKDTPVEILKTVTNQLMDIMPINPMGGWEEFIPSMAKATVEAGVAIPFLGEPIKGTNKNFAGAPLRDEKPWLSDAERESMPKYAFAGYNTWNWLVDLAELANRATGGTKYEAGWLQLDPARIQHYAEQATGGIGGFVGKLASTVNAAFDSETEVKVSTIPFLNKVFTIADEKGQNKLTTEQFYYYKGVAEASEMRYSNYVKEGDKESKKKERNSDEYKIMKIYNKYDAGEEMYKSRLKRARNSAEEKDIKAKRDARRKEFINELAEKGLL